MGVVHKSKYGTLIKADESTNRMGMVFNMLDMGIEKRIEMMNEQYKGKITFSKIYGGIYISRIEKGVTSIELPEESHLEFESLIMDAYSHIGELISVKLPKACTSINLERASWVSYIKTLFVWDTTELTGTDGIGGLFGSCLERIIIQSTTGGKAQIINLRHRKSSVSYI